MQAGLPIRLQIQRSSCEVEIQLGESVLFYPSDAALQMLIAQVSGSNSHIVYD
jgi:hypothetical protein